jgi:hypothetical protein
MSIPTAVPINQGMPPPQYYQTASNGQGIEMSAMPPPMGPVVQVMQRNLCDTQTQMNILAKQRTLR